MKYNKGEYLLHKDQKLFFMIDGFYVPRFYVEEKNGFFAKEKNGYILKILGKRAYNDRNNKKTRWVKYTENRINKECVKVDNDKMLKILYGD